METVNVLSLEYSSNKNATNISLMNNNSWDLLFYVQKLKSYSIGHGENDRMDTTPSSVYYFDPHRNDWKKFNASFDRIKNMCNCPRRICSEYRLKHPWRYEIQTKQ